MQTCPTEWDLIDAPIGARLVPSVDTMPTLVKLRDGNWHTLINGILSERSWDSRYIAGWLYECEEWSRHQNRRYTYYETEWVIDTNIRLLLEVT